MFISVRSAEKLVYVNPTRFVVTLARTGSYLMIVDSVSLGKASILIISPVSSPWSDATPTFPKNFSTLEFTFSKVVARECANPELDFTN